MCPCLVVSVILGLDAACHLSVTLCSICICRSGTTSTGSCVLCRSFRTADGRFPSPPFGVVFLSPESCEYSGVSECLLWLCRLPRAEVLWFLWGLGSILGLISMRCGCCSFDCCVAVASCGIGATGCNIRCDLLGVTSGSSTGVLHGFVGVTGSLVASSSFSGGLLLFGLSVSSSCLAKGFPTLSLFGLCGVCICLSSSSRFTRALVVGTMSSVARMETFSSCSFVLSRWIGANTPPAVPLNGSVQSLLLLLSSSICSLRLLVSSSTHCTHSSIDACSIRFGSGKRTGIPSSLITLRLLSLSSCIRLSSMFVLIALALPYRILSLCIRMWGPCSLLCKRSCVHWYSRM